MNNKFCEIKLFDKIQGKSFTPTKQTIREFCEASLDHNPLHLDDQYVADNFSNKSEFDGIVMHGMSQFSIYTQLITDWCHPIGGIHRRMETRWLKPVKPGDSVTPFGEIIAKDTTQKSGWITISLKMINQHEEIVSKGEAQIEFISNQTGVVS